MNTMTRDNLSNPSPTASRGAGVHRGIWIGGGLMAVTIVALATALVVKSHDPNGDAATPLMAPQTASTTPATDPLSAAPATAAGTTTAAPVNESQTAAAAVATAPPATTAAPRTTYVAPAPRQAAPAYDGGTQSVATAPPPAAAPERVAAAPVCHTCGVVESYSTQRVAGQVNGVGAVAGGVGGALIGSQIAGRGNHTLGGVLGAVGGGLLGNTIERHERAYTVYDAHVRMNDGSYRTIRETTMPQVGEHVVVEGHTMRPAR
jgi:outer membrane lipoprotein SlyB